MAFDFPAAPVLNDEYTSGGVTYVFNGQGWTLKASGGAVTDLWVDVTGDTMTGALVMDSAVGAESRISGNKANSSRWHMLLGNSVAEGGGNVGSDFALQRCDDTGAVINNTIIINRSDGRVTIPGSILTHDSFVMNNNVVPGQNVFWGYGNPVTTSASWDLRLGNGAAGNYAFNITRYNDLDQPITAMQIDRLSGAAKFIGELTVEPFGANLTGRLIINKTGSGQYAQLLGTNNGQFRWSVNLGDLAVENGLDSGSDFMLARYTDAQVPQGAILISRANAAATFYGNITAPSGRFNGTYTDGWGVTSNMGYFPGAESTAFAGGSAGGLIARVCMYDLGAVAWSFYGNTSALLSGGTWTASDAGLKDVTGTLDPASALGIVNAIAVKRFTPKNDEAQTILYGNVEVPELVGWIAQDVEPVLPVAVRDIPVPPTDLMFRAAMKNVPMPEKDTPEATTLADEVINAKTMNDHYMLATLWAAVQALSAEIQALKATPLPTPTANRK
jgi:hypothetical protein